eukprot:GHVN01062913.1.p1 GENE.GHVN01062913.1~~GHVN01062913.1.p1  ORF type:complete len:127 (+),score=19.62 GHVN01062913.1:271-651(+)
MDEKLAVGVMEDIDEWFLRFEDKFRAKRVGEKRRVGQLMDNLSHQAAQHIQAAPANVSDPNATYWTVRDWFVSEFGPDKPLLFYQRALGKLAGKQLLVLGMDRRWCDKSLWLFRMWIFHFCWGWTI